MMSLPMLQPGTPICITINGQHHGIATNGFNYGCTDNDDWRIEFINANGQFCYWMQSESGGILTRDDKPNCQI